MRFNKRATKRRSDEATKGKINARRDSAFPSVASSLRRFVALPQRGFSLIEIMTVVVIIGLLAGIVAYATTGYLEKAKEKRARADVAHYAGAIDAFYLDKGRFPTNQEGLKVLVPQFVKVLQNDPWGRPYQYLQPGKKGPYDVVSYGADGREGGNGADADISNSDPEVAAVKGKP